MEFVVLLYFLLNSSSLFLRCECRLAVANMTKTLLVRRKETVIVDNILLEFECLSFVEPTSA